MTVVFESSAVNRAIGRAAALEEGGVPNHREFEPADGVAACDGRVAACARRLMREAQREAARVGST
jgi:hypothetical protein